MHVICPHCEKKALITSSNILNDRKTIKDLYCTCSNRECGASFVFRLAYSHTLNPPIYTTVQIAIELVKHFSEEEKTALEQAAFR